MKTKKNQPKKVEKAVGSHNDLQLMTIDRDIALNTRLLTSTSLVVVNQAQKKLVVLKQRRHEVEQAIRAERMTERYVNHDRA